MRPISVVDDIDFKELMLTGRPNLKLPSRRTVGRDLAEIYHLIKGNLIKYFEVCTSCSMA
jgi:hypothetical protein